MCHQSKPNFVCLGCGFTVKFDLIVLKAILQQFNIEKERVDALVDDDVVEVTFCHECIKPNSPTPIVSVKHSSPH